MPLELPRPLAMSNCCKDCVDRAVGCHATCERYLVAKKHHDELREEYHRQNYNTDRYRTDSYFRHLNHRLNQQKKHITVRRNYK